MSGGLGELARLFPPVELGPGEAAARRRLAKYLGVPLRNDPQNVRREDVADVPERDGRPEQTSSTTA